MEQRLGPIAEVVIEPIHAAWAEGTTELSTVKDVGASLIIALVLAVVLPCSALAAPPQDPQPGGAKAGLPLPHDLPLQDYERVLYKFLFTRAYAAPPYSWAQDKVIRDTGPFVSGEYHGSHPAVRVFYSPEVMNWLKGDRKGDVADGGMIIKEMFYPPATLYYEPTFGNPPLKDPAARAALFDSLMFAWTVMVKDRSVAKGGWFYSDLNAPVPKIERGTKTDQEFDAAIEAAVTPVLDSYQLNADPSQFSFPSSGVALGTCQRCHASAASEMTFSSLSNIQGQPLRFRIDDSWREESFLSARKKNLPDLFAPAAPAGQGASPQLAVTRGSRALPARTDLDANREPGEYFISAGHRPPPRRRMPSPGSRGLEARAPMPPPAPNPEFVATFRFARPTTDPKTYPSQWADHVVAGPNGAESFITSDNCLGCHGGLGGGTSGLAMFFAMGKNYGEGYNLSEYGEWRWSPMGLAGRDPIFHAQIESELALLDAEFSPALAATAKTALINLCVSCHGAMGQRQLAIDAQAGPTSQVTGRRLDPNFKLEYFDLTTALNAEGLKQKDYEYHKYGNLAREGVSCTICHHIDPPDPAKVKASKLSDLGYFLMNNTTGRFERGPDKTLNGPFEKVAVLPMEASLGITPKFSPYVKDSRLCGTCHTINLPNVDAKHREFEYLDEAETIPEFKPFPHSLEQATFVEWQNSVFADKANAKEFKSCQDCHMPGGFASKDKKFSQLVTQIATIQDTTVPMAEHGAPAEAVHVPMRGDYKRHEMVGLNVFVESMFDQFFLILGVDKFDPMTYASSPKEPGDADYNGNKLAIDNMVRQAREDTVDLAVKLVDDQAPPAGQLVAEVTVTNKVGHRFPSGVGFRRAFLEVVATKKSTGQVVWGSGRTNSVGVIVDGQGTPLPSEFLPDAKTFQPHYQEIRGEDQVQIYEELTLNGKNEFTTSFIHRVSHPKDNRLLARGWLSGKYLESSGPVVKQFLAASDPEGASVLADPDFSDNDGKGATGIDHIRYVMSLPAGVEKSDVAVKATMYYQSIPPFYLQQRFQLAPDGAATKRLYYIASRLKTTKDTAIADWKLQLVSTTTDAAPKAPPGPAPTPAIGERNE
jgi:cytochrome c553